MIKVQPYQARLPMHGSGGVTSIRPGTLDLRERPGDNPIVAAVQQFLDRKRQAEQDELKRELTEAKITEMGQEKPRQGKIVKSGDKVLLIDSETGETIRELPAPKGKAATNLINAWLKLGETLDPTAETEAVRGAIGQQIMDGFGVELPEEIEEEAPPKKTWGWPTLTKPAYRVRPERTETRKKSTPITEALEKTEPERKELSTIAGELKQRPQRALRMKAKPKEPATVDEFETEVARLKKIDMKAAKAYYNKWVVKWR